MRNLIVVCALFFLPLSVFGHDDLRNRADAAWQDRDDQAKAEQALELYRKLAEQHPDSIDLRIREARAAYWVIEVDEIRSAVYDTERMDKDEQAAFANQGIAACREVLSRDSENHRAHYWLIWNMAARTLAQGLFSGFAFKDSIMGTIMVSKADHSYQYGGIYRYWARIIHYMPGLLGRFFHFTEKDAVRFYKQAIGIQPNYLRSHFWLAETYEELDMPGKAKEEYRFCVDFPEGSLPEVAPENKLYRLWAKKRLEERF
ncbi:MAG: hypothetical protein R6V10_01745 [bacterium]